MGLYGLEERKAEMLKELMDERDQPGKEERG